jgi:hypothetical protein
MKNISSIKSIFCFALLAVILSSCEQDVESDLTNFVALELSPITVNVENNSTLNREVKIYSKNVVGSDRTFNLVVNTEASTLESPYSVPSSVTIPANSNEGVFTVSITDDENLQFVVQKLVVDLEPVAGLDTGGELVLNVTELCVDSIVNLELELDTWPDETTWELYDLTGAPEVIASGGPFSNPEDDFAVYSYDFCLGTGDYGIVVYDSFGDGGSSYTVTVNGGVVAQATLVSTFSSSEFSID